MLNIETSRAYFVAPSGKVFGCLDGELFYTPGDGLLHKLNIRRDDTAPSQCVTFSALNIGIQLVTIERVGDVIEYAGEQYAFDANYELEMPLTRIDPDYLPQCLFRTAGNKLLLICFNLATREECAYFDGKPVDEVLDKFNQDKMYLTIDGHEVVLTRTEEEDGTHSVKGTLDGVTMEPLTLTDYAYQHGDNGTITIA